MEYAIQQFATQHRLHTHRDECGDLIISGRHGDIFNFGGNRLGVCLMFDTRRAWTYARRKLLADGFILTQDGETEGVATFPPSDPKQARAAIQAAGVRTKRQLSAAQRAALVARLQKAQKVGDRRSNA